MQSITDGSRKLLSEVIEVLCQHDEGYIVIGGWCPVLRPVSGLLHPGTIDVDILFQNSFQERSIESVIAHFLDSGFHPSAKHRFQLNKNYRIGELSYTFHIDLLHPRMVSDLGSLFVDHLNLDVPFSAHDETMVTMRSIVLPNSRVLFEKSLYTVELHEGQPFNLITYEGMVLTKMDSCQKSKRERDSFDIFTAFNHESFDFSKIENLASSENDIGSSIERFRKFLSGDSAYTFDLNVERFVRIEDVHNVQESPSNYILERMQG